MHVCLHTETFVWHQSSCISEILQTADVSSNVCSIFLVPMSCTIYGFHHKFLVAVIIQSSLLNGPLLVASSNKTLNPSSSVLAALLAQFSCTCLSMVYRIFFLSVGQKNKNTSYSLSTRHFFDKKQKGSHQEVANCSHKKLNATTSTLNWFLLDFESSYAFQRHPRILFAWGMESVAFVRCLVLWAFIK